MAAIDFPNSPTLNQQVTLGGFLWQYNGTSWKKINAGKSAYLIAVNNGFVGTEAEWLASLEGDDGVSISTTAPENTDLLWIDTSEAGSNVVPAGGATGQALVKASGDDYDTEWSSNFAVSHNYVINGAFDIWQRGTSGFADSSYTADRWRVFYGPGGTGTVTQEAFSPADIEAIGFGDAKYFMRFDQTTAASANNANINTRIEDVRTLAGQTVTLSFWAKAESSRNLDIQSVYVPDGSAGGTDNQVTIAITTTWQRYSVTFTRTSTSGMTIGSNSYVEIRFRNAQQIAEYFDIWGVQLEAGSVATPFKRNANSIQAELAACQRYYQAERIHFGLKLANGYARINLPLLGQMRAAPTIIYKDAAGTLNRFTSFASNDALTNGRTPIAVVGETTYILFLPDNTDSDTAFQISASASAEL